MPSFINLDKLSRLPDRLRFPFQMTSSFVIMFLSAVGWCLSGPSKKEPAVRIRDLLKLGSGVALAAAEPLTGSAATAKASSNILRQYKKHRRWKREMKRQKLLRLRRQKVVDEAIPAKL